jgi:hypothetical protein
VPHSLTQNGNRNKMVARVGKKKDLKRRRRRRPWQPAGESRVDGSADGDAEVHFLLLSLSRSEQRSKCGGGGQCGEREREIGQERLWAANFLDTGKHGTLMGWSRLKKAHPNKAHHGDDWNTR